MKLSESPKGASAEVLVWKDDAIFGESKKRTFKADSLEGVSTKALDWMHEVMGQRPVLVQDDDNPFPTEVWTEDHLVKSIAWQFLNEKGLLGDR